jgi:tRNA threonylcarbamoyladenosine dehydratase
MTIHGFFQHKTMAMSKQQPITNGFSSTILVSFAAGCATIVTAQLIVGRLRSLAKTTKRSQKDDVISASTVNASSTTRTTSSSSISLTPLMRREQLSRHYLYFGESGMEQLRNARVLIVGVGGVGSHAAHMLARSGIGHLKLIDYDQLTLSSLNRHACGVVADVGRPKVEILANFLRQICPNDEYLHVETENVMYTADTGAALLDNHQHHHDHNDGENDKDDENGTTTTKLSYWDMVLDCIDDVPTKAVLVADCLQRQLPIISCMSAGGKADPTRLLLTDLRSAAKDPLATKLRITLQQNNQKQQHPIPDRALEDMDQLTIVYSSEKTVMKLADLTNEQKTAAAIGSGGDLQQFGAVDGMRIRIVPVQGTMPAIMGQAMAAYCLNRLTTTMTEKKGDDGTENSRMQPATVEKLGKSTRHKLYQHFQNRERKLYDTAHSTAAVVQTIQKVDEHDETLGEYVTFQRRGGGTDDDDETRTTTTTTTTMTWWVGTTVQINITDDMEYLLEIWRNRCAISAARIGTTLHLVRWDLQRPSTLDNIILLGDKGNILQQFDADRESFKAGMDQDLRRSIEQRLLLSRVHSH